MTSIIQVQNSLSTASWRYTDILVHHPTSSHIPQKHAVHLCKTVQYSNLFSGSGWLWQFGRFTVKALLTGFQARPNSLNPLWKDTFCMTEFEWSHAFPSPHATLQKVPQLNQKKHRIWQYDSIPALVTLEQSLGLESHLDRLNRFATAIVWGFRKSLKPNSPGETSIPCFERPTFHWMAWFFEEGKLSIPSFHQSKTPRKQKRYLNI